MKYLFYFGLAILALFVLQFIYFAYVRPVDPVQSVIYDLVAHFKKNGINVEAPYPVRHGYFHSQITAVAAMPIKDFPLPITITVCANNAQAERYFLSAKSSPRFMHTTINSQLVMVLPMWGDDTDELANKAVLAFSNFQVPTEAH